MASWFDLKQRVQELEDSGLSIASEYKSDGLPKWLTPALGGCDVFVLNAKGVAVDDTLCIMRLDKLTKMMGRSGVEEKA